jgi:hypothetical protein
MKRAILEKKIALGLFVVVLIVFSIAQNASYKMERFYTVKSHSIRVQKQNIAVTQPAVNPYFTASQAQ